MSERQRRVRQFRAVALAEADRVLLGRRGIPVVVLALLPVLMCVFVVGLREHIKGSPPGFADLQGFWAGLFQGVILRTLVYFGTMWVFINLIRGEVVDRTLHLPFLLPLPRWLLLAGKFVGGWFATALLFGLATALSWFALFRTHLGEAELGQMAVWVGIVLLGIFGYGAIFAVLGIWLRNPIFAAIGLWAWEWLEFLLPGPLKKLSVAHYLKGLAPVRMDEGPLAVIGTTTAAPLAIGGLMVFGGLLLALGAWRLRRLEIDYGGD